MRKLFFLCTFLVLLIMFSTQKRSVLAETPDLDLDSNVLLECVTFKPSGSGGLPKPVEDGTFTGTCSSSTKCDIFVCIPEPSNTCTTFDSAKDMSYFGKDNTGMGLPGVRLTSGNNFFGTGAINEAGQVLNAKGHTGYFFYAAHRAEPSGTGSDAANATQQQGQANLVFPTAAETCAAIYWDPYGRVFDAVSLEPLNENEATVTLLDENGNKSLNTLSNDVLIDKMGKYNILINQDGQYKLNVTPKTDHLFTATEPDVRYKDLYDFIYLPGDPAFVEKVDKPKRVDLPLKPNADPYTRSPDYLYKEYKDIWFKGEAFTKVGLRTVHPRTIVKVMVNGVQLTENGTENVIPKTSDKEGYWMAIIKKEVLSQEGFSIELIKNPQYYPLAKNNSYFTQLINKLSSFFIKKVSAQQSVKIDAESPTSATKITSNSKTVMKFEPILTYVEGYAYEDNEKRIIPKAIVNVKLRMNNRVYYSTTANSLGFFAIYSKNLPPYEFYLQYMDPLTSKTFIKTTGQFVKENEEYIKLENLDLIQARKNDKPIITPTTAVGQPNQRLTGYNLPKDNNPNIPSENKIGTQAKGASFFNPTVTVIAIVILFLIGVSVSLFIYIKKSRNF